MSLAAFFNVILMVAGIANAQSAITSNLQVLPSLLQSSQDTIVNINPPLLGFYSKYLNCDGIPIRAANVVDDKAMYIASNKIRLMLKQMNVARKNLIKAGAELHVIGKDQQTSDLPEFADQKGVSYIDQGVVTDIDKRTRGMGGLYASCGEENLLQLSSDRYYGGSDICIHEFAHTIMNYGLDDAVRLKIQSRYNNALAKGLWKNAYAASNPQEYWAELSMWYFGAHGEFLQGTRLPDPGSEGLSKYDNAGYKLLDSIYSGLIQPGIQGKASVAIMKGAVSGVSAEKSEFTFINNKSSLVRLYWIDWNGNAKLYATVPSKGHVVQPTFVSHVWMFEDETGKSLFYIRVNDPPCEIKLNDDH